MTLNGVIAAILRFFFTELDGFCRPIMSQWWNIDL